MRVGIAIDVSTDVSHEFVVANAVQVLPSTIRCGQMQAVYDRDPERALAFYRNLHAEHLDDAETIALTVREIEGLFLRELVLDYDYVFLITLAASRSLTYENAHKASFTILQSYGDVRASHGVPGAFALRVVDSRNLFTGPGVLAWEAVRLAREGATPTDIRLRLDQLTPQLHVYVIPADIPLAFKRARQRGERSIGAIKYWGARMLDIHPIIHLHGADEVSVAARLRHWTAAAERLLRHAAEQIETGLKLPFVNLSYGGDLAVLTSLPAYAELARVAEQAGVELMCSMMAPAAAVNIGAGALSLAYCAERPRPF